MDFIKKKLIKSWGRKYYGEFKLYEPKKIDEIKEIILENTNVIPSGGFRSYGDSAINSVILNSKFFNNIISFNEKTGLLKAQSGVTIEKLINFLIPKGWFLKVTPGTKFATLGGCIASDVHGKEHHQEGCFSSSIKKIKILLNEKDLIEFTKESDPDLFKSTCGGMGLTGFILEAEIECKKIKSSNIKYQKIINETLEEVFSCFEKYKSYNYSVAWLDTKKKKKSYRSVFSFGKFNNDSNFELSKKKRFEYRLPFNLINNFSITLFNNFYFYLSKITKKKGFTNYDNFFYPLDSIKNWYKIYGSRGFVQYQFIVPINNGKECIYKILKFMNKNNFLSSLCVLKLHEKNNENFLSFPKLGYSLAMDFPLNDKTIIYLNEIDRMVLEYGGRVYLTKDGRLDKDYFNKFYPSIKQLLDTKVKYKIFNFSSKQSKRHGINEK